MRRIAGIFGSLLILALIAAYFWGGKTEVDSVRAARERFDVDFRSQMVATNGIRLHVVDAGPADGPLVVLLHGYPEFWWAWKEQMAHLARAGFHVVAPDQRGYNRSDKPRPVDAYGMGELVADVAGVIDFFGGKALLAGHDWGGAVAWRVAIAHPDKVRRLVIFNMGHPLAFAELNAREDKPESTSWYRKFFQLPVIPEVGTRMGNWFMLVKSLRSSAAPGVFSDEEIEHYRAAWSRDGAMRSMINWYRAGYRRPDNVEPPAVVDPPVRIVWGAKDVFVPVELAELSAKHCRKAEVIELADATHWLLHEQPEVTSRELIDFFSREAEIRD